MCFVIQHMVKVFQFPGEKAGGVWGRSYSHASPTAYILCSMVHFSESEIKPTPIVSFFSALKEKIKKRRSPGRKT